MAMWYIICKHLLSDERLTKVASLFGLLAPSVEEYQRYQRIRGVCSVT